MNRLSFVIALLLAAGMLGCSGAASTQSTERIAPLLEGMGDHHHPITTTSPLAQRYFDQGLVLAYAFNHAEAERSFLEAARLDPECAMCYWGAAYVLGPNINAAMDPASAPKAFAALQQAVRLAPKASTVEQAYIDALTKRYIANPPEDRSALDRAYADAMREVVQRFPDDPDAAALFAEAYMTTTPWNYWTEDGQPREGTQEAMDLLEQVLEEHPNHPLANHLYIHVVEKERPELGIAAADRLGDLVPGAGHLVHMPGHIYIRVGRYHDASVANEKAIAADDSYLTQCHAQGLYPIGYVPHNHHFLWAASTLEGRREVALMAAHHIAAHQDQQLMREPGFGTLQHFWVTPLYARVRFGQWDAILSEPEPADDLVYPRGVWHYARGLALTAKGRYDEAARELEKLRDIAADPVLGSVSVSGLNPTPHVLRIAQSVLAGELAARRGDFETAIRYLEEGVAEEDALVYDEPAAWHHPVRQILGAVLLEAGRAAEAERVYRKDLTIYPENGWSLYGLAQSLHAQGKTTEARAIEQRFETAWQYADVTLTESRVL